MRAFVGTESNCLEERILATLSTEAGCWASLKRQKSLVGWTIKDLSHTKEKSLTVTKKEKEKKKEKQKNKFSLILTFWVTEQDQTIDHLKQSIMRQKDIAISISNELDVHNGKLLLFLLLLLLLVSFFFFFSF
jgi:hypothetical protein